MNLLQPLNEEQKKKLHELHLIQQKELQELIEKHQLQQLQIFENIRREQELKEKLMNHNTNNSSLSQSRTFKPYTLSQYRLLKLQPILKNPSKGLGPTLSIEKWQQQKEKMERMSEFAEQVKQRIPVKISRRSPQRNIEQKESAQQRAMNFAKKLKPIMLKQKKIENNNNNNEDENYLDEDEQELQQYELRNQQLREQIKYIK